MERFVEVLKGERVEIRYLSTIDYPNARPFMVGQLSSGDFGPASDEIAKITGMTRYNIQYEFPTFRMKNNAVSSCQGKRIHRYALLDGKLETVDLLDDKQLEALKEKREPLDFPVLPSYIIPKPGQSGRILWFSGVPGAGKSTSAQLMARNHNYVYYELDCICSAVNPYIDISVDNPTMQQTKQKSLKIVSEDFVKMTEDWSECIQLITQGKIADIEEKFDSCVFSAANHIIQQRQRLGGDWAVAFAIFTQKQREKLRQIIGPDLIFIVLGMTEECMRKRLMKRHQGQVQLVDAIVEVNKLYEDVGDDEQNAYRIIVDESMSREDVIDKTLEIIGST